MHKERARRADGSRAWASIERVHSMSHKSTMTGSTLYFLEATQIDTNTATMTGFVATQQRQSMQPARSQGPATIGAGTQRGNTEGGYNTHRRQ